MNRTAPMRRTSLRAMSPERERELREAGTFPFTTFRPRTDWKRLDRKPMSASHPKPAVPATTRKRLSDRSEKVCEMQLSGCTWWATDPSHRDGRGMGGRHGEAAKESARLSNNVHACRACHRWCHEHVTEAEQMGLFLRSGQDPATTPLLYRGEVKFLDDLGGVWDFEEVGA